MGLVARLVIGQELPEMPWAHFHSGEARGWRGRCTPEAICHTPPDHCHGGVPSNLHISRFRVKYAGAEEDRAPKNAILEGLGPSIRDTRYAAAKEPSLCLTFPNKWLSWRGFPRARKFTAGRL